MIIAMIVLVSTVMNTAATGFCYSCTGQASTVAKALYCSQVLNCTR